MRREESRLTGTNTCSVPTLPAERPGKLAPTGPGVPKKDKAERPGADVSRTGLLESPLTPADSVAGKILGLALLQKDTGSEKKNPLKYVKVL